MKHRIAAGVLVEEPGADRDRTLLVSGSFIHRHCGAPSLSNIESRGSLAPRPPETDVAATLAWFIEREKALQREGRYDAAAQAALEAEVEAYGARTLAAMDHLQQETESPSTSTGRQSKAASAPTKPRSTIGWIGLAIAIAILALVVSAAYLTRH